MKQTPNSIGYVELIYAVQNNMPYGKVQNAAGRLRQGVARDGVTAAAAGAAKNMPEDFRVSITNAPGKEAYPISSFTWLLIPDQIADRRRRRRSSTFLKWMLADGQNHDRGAVVRAAAEERGRERAEGRSQDSISMASDGSLSTAQIRDAGPGVRERSLRSAARAEMRSRTLIAMTFAASILLITVLLVLELFRSTRRSAAAKFGWSFFCTQTWDPVAGRFRRAAVHLRHAW